MPLFPIVPGKSAAGTKSFVSARKYSAMDRKTAALKRSSVGKKRSEMPAARRINDSGAILNCIENPLLSKFFCNKNILHNKQ
jgi:hypothetical protein